MNADHLAHVDRVYTGSDGFATKALYARLEGLGPRGVLAVNLFRAQKASERAKVYRGGIRGKGSYRGMAYDRKQWSMDNLARVLAAHGEALGVRWGWQQDPEQPVHCWVLYVDTPQGQVSFHTDRRGAGPDYGGAWDGQRGQSPSRIVAFVATVLEGAEARA